MQKAKSSSNELTDALIDRFSKRWQSTNSSEHKELLRLSILRDLSREIHSERSIHIATQRLDQDRTLKHLEPIVEGLRTKDLSTYSLLEAIQENEDIESKVRTISKSASTPIPDTKINRPDRLWERELLACACDCRWHLWTLTAELKVENVEEFHRDLGKSIWPNCIILFVESVSPSSTTAWTGQWTVLCEPSHEPKTPRLNVSSAHAQWKKSLELGGSS